MFQRGPDAEPGFTEDPGGVEDFSAITNAHAGVSIMGLPE
jgi:hypothetical protein